ncbi:heparan-sulfate lyase [Mucilaginibacter yixingensis]|uniref:Heparan-sulfate lyase n=1 Tax=Mucilaginibacter yixingensis TaxID=1295612 RepID=A0A2T5J610_9SPHI|nr:heparin-sulfate lyase HepC [Mucilaginibacter yixingensis]PTQ93973.1 heparan-sulfate lyase [Mucilaginibacter yixingensis]
MKIFFSTMFTCLLFTGSLLTAHAQEQPVTKESFACINLKHRGLEKVRQQFDAGRYDAAATALLSYYRNRTGMLRPNFDLDELKRSTGKKLSPDIREAADNALLHKFKPHKAYPYYDFGKDINWQLRPVPDQLFNTFLHRTAFWEPLGKAYWATGDERYAREWITEVRDWIKKNQPGAYPDDKDYAWKAFVVSFRLNYWSSYFNMFLKSPNFTPAFLMEFLDVYAQQADYVLANYTPDGNHRLFEAEHMMYAGYSFPEMQHCSTWSASGIKVLNEEIGKQILPDGVDFELSTSYHITVLTTFLEGLKIAQQAGAENDFPESYRNLVKQMIDAVGKYSFPDYTFPLYGNSFLTDKAQMIKSYRDWSTVFPLDQTIRWFATDGASGSAPDYHSSALHNAGFYTFRSSNPLDMKSTVMQIKAGPPAGFHSHPDNGNFVLWVKGRNFTPDAGSFVYANVGNIVNPKRDWYRSTKAHQTLTLDDQNIENKAEEKKWTPSGDIEVLTYTNPSYEHLSHQRSFLFVDHAYLIIVDKAYGSATGKLGIHFNLQEDSKPVVDQAHNRINTTYADGNNLLIQNLNADQIGLKATDSFVSYQYQKEKPRPAFVFEKPKANANAQTFITILYPYTGKTAPNISLKENAGNDYEKGVINITITVNGRKRDIQTTLLQ